MTIVAPPVFRFARAGDPDGAHLIDALRAAPALTVAVAVHNGGQVVARCLEALLRHTTNADILVVDDATNDRETLEILARFDLDERVRVVRNPENLGYTRTANRAIALAAGNDVVLVNSDAVVGPQWAQRLRWTAYSRPGVASVSAVSDNAGAMSVPEIGRFNQWAPHLGSDDVATYIAHRTRTFWIETPTAHGFCVYIRREALDMVGAFDEVAFPRGYGEENDFSMRASRAGFVHLVAPHVFVRHEQGASFGSDRAALIAEAREVLDDRYPDYTPAVRSWASGDSLAAVQTNARQIQEELSSVGTVRPRTLYVLHGGGGGTPATNRDLMLALQDRQESFVLVARARQVDLYLVGPKGDKLLESWQPARPFTIRDDWRADYGALVARVLARHAIRLVHIRHVIDQPLGTVTAVAKLLGVPVIVSTHDFYLVCPSVHLLDDRSTFCGGVCTPGEGQCASPSRFVAGITNLKHHWVYQWRERGHKMLAEASAIITTTPSAREVIERAFPDLGDRMLTIEHGRDIRDPWVDVRRDRPRRPGPLRVLCPANWDPHKGSRYLAEAIEESGLEVEWHLLGSRGESVHPAAISHGTYTRDVLPELVDQIDPDFIGLFSIWAETYSHTLTEAWALGVPVIATDIGAVADRVREHGGGLLAPVDDPSAVAALVRELSTLALAGRLVRPEVPRSSIRSVTTMAEDYAELYERVRDGVDRKNLGVVIHGGPGQRPGSAHVRVTRRLAHASGGAWRARIVDASDLISGNDTASYSAFLVQRDALSSELGPEFRALAAKRGIPIVFELDDDLLSDEALGELTRAGYRAENLRDMRETARVAGAVVVSTPKLSHLVSGFASRVSLVRNEVDGRLWGHGHSQLDREGPIRALYMGSPTHSDDLELLRPVFEAFAARGYPEITLEVVGVTRNDSDWFDRLEVPAQAHNYPEFVRWLRSLGPRWRMGLAPLLDTSFNRNKSDLKFLEYSALGLPVIASDVPPYAEITAHGGRTVANSPEEWMAAIGEFAASWEVAQAAADRGHDYVHRERSIATGEAQRAWRTVVESAIRTDK